jgi:hypothetical protein
MMKAVNAQPKTAPPPSLTSVGGGLLQRKCACGPAGIAEECDGCSKQNLSLQRSTRNSEPETRNSGGVPPIVSEVLRSAGQPLDAKTRAFFEPRFGHNFSMVRVHADTAAAQSAQSMNARAYTVDQHTVFAAGQYAPHTAEGKRLLAHELTHTIQQKGKGVGVAKSLMEGPADDESEREANAVANSVMSTEHAALSFSVKRSEPALLQRQQEEEDQLTEQEELARQAKLAEDESDQEEEPICGPNVTVPVIVATNKVKNAFKQWNWFKQGVACKGLINPLIAYGAWDITELHIQDWIYSNYGPNCATADASPACHASVQIVNDCHYAGSVNYVIFGTMCKLCFDHYQTKMKDPDQFIYTKELMLELINLYKGGDEPSANFEESKAWASAGYDGWPSGGSTPEGDRKNCRAICEKPYTGPAFTVTWYPFEI